MEIVACLSFLMTKKINIEDTLLSLGYRLSDRGSYWQTNALFRNGDNKTALQIYKDSGVWKDYVNNTAYMPFEKLVQATLGTTDSDLISSSCSFVDSFEFKTFKNLPKPMEKTYDPSCLERLLPHFDFYTQKGISDSVLKLFKCGLCTEGKMYQRLVFPIYNLQNKIHGFSGRDMLDSENRPKWKHIGVKTKWIYPHHLSSDYITDQDSVILVESIGDVLNLYSNGIKNCLCIFGLDISPSLISYLIQLNPQKIIISLNNDDDKQLNRGLAASIKCFYKLISFFNYDKVVIHPPSKNDFGDMDQLDIKNWLNKLDLIMKSFDYNYILDNSKILYKSQNLTQSLNSKINKFKKIINNE
jgi:hypothetical protein